MADTDWAEDVKEYAPDADAAAITGSSVIAGSRCRAATPRSSPSPTSRSFLKKKLGLDMADDELDPGIAAIGGTLKGVHKKNHVTVYQLPADRFGELSAFA